VRLAEWPRNPFLNDELRDWISMHLDALHVEDVAIYAVAQGRDDEGRRVLIATEIGLLDGSYAPRGSAAHYSLQLRLFPWQAVRGMDLLSETYRLWAYEHRTWWRLRLGTPSLDVQTEDPALGRALADLATACSVMAEPTGQREPSTAGDGDRPASAPRLARASTPMRDAMGPGQPVAEEPVAEQPEAEPEPDLDPDVKALLGRERPGVPPGESEA
jgi:hypothetical protein